MNISSFDKLTFKSINLLRKLKLLLGFRNYPRFIRRLLLSVLFGIDEAGDRVVDFVVELEFDSFFRDFGFHGGSKVLKYKL